MAAIVDVIVKAVGKMQCFSGKKNNNSENVIDRFVVIDDRMMKMEEHIEHSYDKDAVDQQITALKEAYDYRLKTIEDALGNHTNNLREQLSLKLEIVQNKSDLQFELIKHTNHAQLDTIKHEVAELKAYQDEISKNIHNISIQFSVLMGYMRQSSKMTIDSSSDDFPPRSLISNID